MKLPDPDVVSHKVGQDAARIVYNHIENRGTLIMASEGSGMQGININNAGPEGFMTNDPKRDQIPSEGINVTAVKKSTAKNIESDGMSVRVHSEDESIVEGVKGRSVTASSLSHWLPKHKTKIIVAAITTGGSIAVLLLKYFLSK
ncbi:hypothetical protein JRI60_01555 [Archangium violaceum]|uniref:hypothetical protein n=1 Tax=Archangium violaceum TaxID=83451 RepID=UPI00194F64EE|nr:hypothetical protein [Archangium violaceum]QRN97798.1 hypothetical protein JRI60_01555 [Archangium violaceum]